MVKQIVVISGKGGTGKTVITASLANLAKDKVMADCDVDAADLHLLLRPQVKESHMFKSGFKAYIDRSKCKGCGQCLKVCRFDAITEDFSIDPVSCEGCAFCSFICPEGAIEMKEEEVGEWFISDTRFGPFIHAKLGIAQENSGKLVTLVREKAKEIAFKHSLDWVIIDGAPGIGCPVIASLSGVDCALVVTEPTLSGLHDAERVINVTRHFNIPVKLVINKHDLNDQMTKRIEWYCKNSDVEIIGKIGFNASVVRAVVEEKTIMEYDCPQAQEEISQIWQRLKNAVLA